MGWSLVVGATDRKEETRSRMKKTVAGARVGPQDLIRSTFFILFASHSDAGGSHILLHIGKGIFSPANKSVTVSHSLIRSLRRVCVVRTPLDAINTVDGGEKSNKNKKKILPLLALVCLSVCLSVLGFCRGNHPCRLSKPVVVQQHPLVLQ